MIVDLRYESSFILPKFILTHIIASFFLLFVGKFFLLNAKKIGLHALKGDCSNLELENIQA
jgi:hypothetical protein